MRILLIAYIQDYQVGTFFHHALTLLGHECAFVDEGNYFKSLGYSLFHKIAFHALGRRPLTYWAFNRKIISQARQFSPHIIIAAKGAYTSPQTLQKIKVISGATLINYATDDPFNPVNSTADLVNSIPLYDVYVSTKRAIINDLRLAGSRNVVYVPFGYDPTQHFPETPTSVDESSRFTSDVAFVGTADGDRYPIMRKLSKEFGEGFALYGGLWNRDLTMRANHRGMVLGREYRLALGTTKIALGLVRHANRDTITMRSFEIPACGTFMLAERTKEHLEVFDEDKHAAFFGSDEELLDKVSFYLRHDTERQRIAVAGYQRIITGNHTYKDRVQTILRYAQEMK